MCISAWFVAEATETVRRVVAPRAATSTCHHLIATTTWASAFVAPQGRATRSGAMKAHMKGRPARSAGLRSKSLHVRTPMVQGEVQWGEMAGDQGMSLGYTTCFATYLEKAVG